MNNQDNNQQKKLPVPKYLTAREKANLMVAWARTNNKIDEKYGTITYPDGKVVKLKPKAGEQQETPTQESKKYENKAAKIIAIYTKAGIYKLSDIIEDAYAKFGELSKEMFDAIKQGYASFRETADDDTYTKLDKNTRDYTYETLINKITNDEQDKDQQEKEYQIQLNHLQKTVKNYLKQNHKSLYKSLVKDNEMSHVANRRATLFLEQLEISDNPQQDKEIYFKQMLEF